MNKISLVALFAGVLFLTACNDTNAFRDAFPPFLSTQEPQEGAEFQHGDDFIYAATFNDNERLRGYNYTIEPIALMEDSNDVDLRTWRLDSSFSLPPFKNHGVRVNVDIPETAPAGKYLFSINCTDQFLNISPTIEKEFFVTRDIMDPDFLDNQCNGDSNFIQLTAAVIGSSDSISITGSVGAINPMINLEINIYQDSVGGALVADKEISFANNVCSQMIDGFIMGPSASGDYAIEYILNYMNQPNPVRASTLFTKP